MLPSFETVCLVVLTALTVSGLWALWPAETPGVISGVEAEPTAGVDSADPEPSEEIGSPALVATGAPLNG